MVRTDEAKLARLAEEYEIGTGPLDWRAILADANPAPDQTVARALLCLSGIEADSQVIYRKIRDARIDRNPYLRRFILPWLEEEAAHGHSLRHLAYLMGASEESPRRARYSRKDALVLWVLGRTMAPAVRATYCVLGTMQEYIALTVYHEIASMIPDKESQLLLQSIARQESRHMRFYRGAAEVLLKGPFVRGCTRWMLRQTWRPPGLDLVDRSTFFQTFGFLLGASLFRDKLCRVDRTVSALPGLNGLSLMSRWLDHRNIAQWDGRYRLRRRSLGGTNTGEGYHV